MKEINKKLMIVSMLISIVIIAIALFNGIVKVYDIVSYRNFIHFLPLVGVISLVLGIALFVMKKGKYTLFFQLYFSCCCLFQIL